MSKAKILKKNKLISKQKSVSVYVESYINEDYIVPVICEFEDDGKIKISLNLSQGESLENINVIIKNGVNPIIKIIKQYFSESGYNIQMLDSLFKSNIEILNIDYVCRTRINRRINLKSMKCISALFNIVDDKSDTKIMRFKRVSNFNEMDSQEAYIIESLNRNKTENEVIDGLSKTLI